MNKIKILIQKPKEGKLSVPKQGTPQSAGYDIIATSEPKIVGEYGNGCLDVYKRIDYIEYQTNLSIYPFYEYEPHSDSYKSYDWHTLIFPRSSISKYNLMLKNSIGLIDQDFSNTISIRMAYLFQPEDFMFESDASGALSDFIGCRVNYDKIYKKGDKCAQLLAQKTNYIDFEVVDELPKTERNLGGFGSTGQ